MLKKKCPDCNIFIPYKETICLKCKKPSIKYNDYRRLNIERIASIITSGIIWGAIISIFSKQSPDPFLTIFFSTIFIFIIYFPFEHFLKGDILYDHYTKENIPSSAYKFFSREKYLLEFLWFTGGFVGLVFILVIMILAYGGMSLLNRWISILNN